MALLPIRIYGDPILRTRSEPIREVDEGILSLALDMLETMRHEEGIGLAAVQIGRPIRMLVADVGDRAPNGVPKIFINPEILDTSGEWVFDEGCLSIPGITAEIVRPKQIRLRFTDGRGAEREEVFDELLARVLQHEIDHLNGTLFVDHLAEVERAAIWSRLLDLEKRSGRRAPAL